MARITHFEIHASNFPRASKFYHDVFGWEIKEWKIPGIEIKEENRYFLIDTDPKKTGKAGINGGIIKRKSPITENDQAVNAFICSLDVENLDEVIEKISKSGGRIVVPKMPIHEVGWLAYFKDTEGNIFGAMQTDKNAKGI